MQKLHPFKTVWFPALISHSLKYFQKFTIQILRYVLVCKRYQWKHTPFSIKNMRHMNIHTHIHKRTSVTLNICLLNITVFLKHFCHFHGKGLEVKKEAKAQKRRALQSSEKKQYRVKRKLSTFFYVSCMRHQFLIIFLYPTFFSRFSLPFQRVPFTTHHFLFNNRKQKKT